MEIDRVLCQIVLVNINLINVTIMKDEENHPFIIPLIKKTLAIKWEYFL